MALPVMAAMQLSKDPQVDDASIATSNALPILPALAAGAPPQIPFPAYDLGYDRNNPPEYVSEHTPQLPGAGYSSPHPFQMLSPDNLHPLLFQLEPCSDFLDGVAVPILVDQGTGIIQTHEETPLRFFSFLPRWIDIDVPGMLLELWFRMDPRLLLSDITNRFVNVNPATAPKSKSAFTNRRTRFRDRIGVPDFIPQRAKPTKAEVDLYGTYDRQQILLNTAMIVDFQNSRFLKPIVGHRGIAGYVDSGLTLDYFLVDDFQQVASIPSERQSIIFALRRRLQRLAVLKGLGNEPSDYTKLPAADLPAHWISRKVTEAVERQFPELDGKTHTEFLEELINNPPAPTAPLQLPTAAGPSQQVIPATTLDNDGDSQMEEPAASLNGDGGDALVEPEAEQFEEPAASLHGDIYSYPSPPEVLQAPQDFEAEPHGEAILRDDEPAWFGHYYNELARQGVEVARTVPRALMWQIEATEMELDDEEN